ncbi:hypothetical protein BDV93DRAFT_523090 [Ceratobasidium sp. AG-I]|nr:hypothetical protein BDV93DRAFT_523090 [Ceratobasidium sp. AG-I]
MSTPPPPAYIRGEADVRQLMALHMLRSLGQEINQNELTGSTSSTNAGTGNSGRSRHKASRSNEARRRQQGLNNPSDDCGGNGSWNNIIEGLAGIIIAPMVLGAGILFAVGSMFLGLGQVFQGVGDFLTWGTFR